MKHTPSAEIAHLHPTAVWNHFAQLSAIPRPSRQEAAVKQHLISWAEQHGLQHHIDTIGNLILRKAASPGCEQAPGVIIQGHLDMVCQANRDSHHNFAQDPIHAKIDGNWLQAVYTTLGADNGIGVAMALAALEDKQLQHPSLEVLLTINEEAGMEGALNLQPNSLHGRYLINLDSEEWGFFYLGCAGGVDIHIEQPQQTQPLPRSCRLWQLDIRGLTGGHSGIDIQLPRANAIKLLAQALQQLSAQHPLQLLTLHGGSARNAIPREARALIALPEDADISDWVKQRQRHLSQDFPTETQLQCRAQVHRCPPEEALSDHASQRLIDFLSQVHNGVAQISQDFPGVTDTSSNLGVVELSQGELNITFKVRSLDDTRRDQLAVRIIQQAQQFRLSAVSTGPYPGWTPNPTSALLQQCQQAYQQLYATPAELQVLHAGLECGIIAGSHPQLEMISFGPDIRGAHAPGEKVNIPSVERCWMLLQAILQRLAQSPC